MESDSEDPFCYRSLKRIKKNKQKSDHLCTARDQQKTELKSDVTKQKTKAETKQKAKRESTDLSSSKIKEDGSRIDGLNLQEQEDADQSHTHMKKKFDDRVRKARNKTVKNATYELADNHCQGNNVNCRATCSFENGYTKIPTISDIYTKQDSESERKNQTEPTFSTETMHNSRLTQNSIQIQNISQMNTAEKRPIVFEEGRCPFCQMPFRALIGQSPNWHTMECMDVPLKTTQECPAGLECDITVVSHYRRYGHSLLAMHLSGQLPQSCDGSQTSLEMASPLDGKLNGSANIESSSPNKKIEPTQTNTKRSSQDHNEGQSKPSPEKQRRSSGQSRCDGSGSRLSPSLSQGSTGSSSSIKDFFSPNGNKAASRDTHTATHGNVNSSEITLDPDLRSLVVSGSDSDEAVESINQVYLDDTDEDETDAGVNNSNPKPFHESKHPSTQTLYESGLSVGGHLGDGFIIEELDDQVALPDRKDVVTRTESTLHRSISMSTEGNSITSAYSDTEVQSSVKVSHTTTMARTASVPVGLQKQTSLFSFFKPHCHYANGSNSKSKPPAPKGGTAISPRLASSEKNMSSMRTGRKPALVKSTSEPVKALRIPSPPPSSATASCTNFRGRPSQGKPAPSAGASFRNSSGRQCPFYKRLPGTSITVDAFNYGVIPGCQAYVLTHFHYDHYQGLSKHFSQSLYCSQVTGNLVQRQVGVGQQYVHTLPLNTPSLVAGVWLTLMEANHCPGAVIILFELPNGKKFLHTGDFRADPSMEQYPPLVDVVVDELYLDTTYCDPAYAFPSQEEAIRFAVSTALKAVKKDPFTLIVCGAYTIGKERVFIALAEALQTKICVQAAKKRVLDCLQDEGLKDRVTLKWTEGSVHVLPMRQLNAKALREHLQRCPQFTAVLAFEPTGWTHSNRTLSLDHLKPKFSSAGITVYGVPYSEHSSYLEMKRFVQFVRPKKILPTVNNGNAASRRKMEAIFSQWLAEGSPQNKTPVQPSLGTWLGKPS